MKSHLSQRRKIMVCSPFYHLENTFNFTITLAYELRAVASAGYELKFQPTIGDAVNRQRNLLAAHFLATDCDALWFIDTDTGFTAVDALKFLAVDTPIVVANYPQRKYFWERALNRVFTSVDELKTALLQGTVVAEKPLDSQPSTLNCLQGGTGMMLIERAVFEEMIISGLVDKLTDDRFPANVAAHLYRFFEFMVINGNDQGEDYWFCDMARALGFKIGCNPDVQCTHAGLEIWSGKPAIKIFYSVRIQHKTHNWRSYMSNYTGTWQLGAGFTVAFNSVTYNDPIGVSLPEVSVFAKDLVTLGGVTALVGQKHNKLDLVKIRVAGMADYSLVAQPPTSSVLTVTWPDGTTKSATAYLIADKAQDVEPEKEMVREITFKPLAVLA